MARTSRKAQVKDSQPEKDLTVRAALYIRLSVEDKHTRTISIETQTLILEHFLEKHPDIFVYDKYIDNGATGTNFHRPAFQQMLSDIEAGYINCVIVKDLSRLGRNTIMTFITRRIFRSSRALISPTWQRSSCFFINESIASRS